MGRNRKRHYYRMIVGTGGKYRTHRALTSPAFAISSDSRGQRVSRCPGWLGLSRDIHLFELSMTISATFRCVISKTGSTTESCRRVP
jgi:hypothetical protein